MKNGRHQSYHGQHGHSDSAHMISRRIWTKPSSFAARSQSLRSSMSTTGPGNVHSSMYRGHISVKHPKRYRRKTAAEMHFAVEDIEIPKGIKHEAVEREEKRNEVGVRYLVH